MTHHYVTRQKDVCIMNHPFIRRISSLLYVSFAKETYNIKEPTTRSHPICVS